MVKKFFILLLCLTGYLLKAQVIFSYRPEVYGRTLDGLGMFQVQNLTGAAQKGQVSISITENTSKSLIAVITTPVTAFPTGVTNFSRSAFSGSYFKFSTNAYARVVNQTRNFPAGNYTFCYHFVSEDKLLDDYENCFDADIQPLVPMTLIHPAEGDKICQKRPVLSWQPPIPFNANMRFRLQLSEKKNGEAMENLLINTPLLLLDNITTTTINYPAAYPDLKEGKTYCWQVLTHQNGVIISRSEIWEFTVQCSEPAKQVENDSYRELKLLVNGNYYIANRYMKFSFQNNYNIKRLNYAIYDIENQYKKVKNVPEVLIVAGMNKIDIDLTDLNLETGKHYVLKVNPFNEPAVEVRFIYEDKDPF